MYISNNAYSGLNSLRGGLKHSYWSGSSLLDTTTFQSESGKPSCNYTISRNMQFGFQDTLSMDSNVFFIRWWGMYWYTYLFLFCFQYGVLKDTSQRLNFNELARVTKKYSRTSHWKEQLAASTARTASSQIYGNTEYTVVEVLSRRQTSFVRNRISAL